MAIWLLLILVLDLQGNSLGVQKNDTTLTDHISTQLKSTDTTTSNVLHATTGEPPRKTETSPVNSPVPKHSTSPPNSRNLHRIATTAPQVATHPIPKTISTTMNSKINTTAKEEANIKNLPEHTETKVTSPLPATTTSTTNSTSSRKLSVSTTAIRHVTTVTSSVAKHTDTQQLSSKIKTPNAFGVTTIEYNRIHTNTSEDESGGEEPATTGAENDSEPDTSTPEETSTEEMSSTEAFTEQEDWSYSDGGETTENPREDDVFHSTTYVPSDVTTTDSEVEERTEDSITEKSSIPNGIAAHEGQPLRAVSSPLTKLILRLSKPGVFEKGKSVFDDDSSTMTTSCPPGDVGLPCRRAEARRTADECSGGNCEVCRSCNSMAATDWPHCCRENFRCCSELALACQQCDQPTLQVFCTKHFKRCF